MQVRILQDPRWLANGAGYAAQASHPTQTNMRMAKSLTIDAEWCLN